MKAINHLRDYSYIIVQQNKFSGILSTEPILKDSVISINDSQYFVEELKAIKCTFFVLSGKVTIEHRLIKYTTPAQLKKFLQSVGICSIKEFIRVFYKKPTLEGTRAIVNLWYVAFNKNQYF